MSDDNPTMKSIRNALWVIAVALVVYTIAQYVVLLAAVMAGGTL